MKHFFSPRVRLVLLIAVLLAVILTVITNLTGMNLPQLAVNGILTPIRSGTSKLVDRAEQLYNYMFSYESLEAENQQLKERIAELEEEARNADTVTRENARLRQMLGLTESREDFKLVDSYIISRSSQEWSSTFTINRGTSSGVREGMCAITANGEVVGLVSEGYTATAVNSIGFIKAIRERLEAKLA